MYDPLRNKILLRRKQKSLAKYDLFIKQCKWFRIMTHQITVFPTVIRKIVYECSISGCETAPTFSQFLLNQSIDDDLLFDHYCSQCHNTIDNLIKIYDQICIRLLAFFKQILSNRSFYNAFYIEWPNFDAIVTQFLNFLTLLEKVKESENRVAFFSNEEDLFFLTFIQLFTK